MSDDDTYSDGTQRDDPVELAKEYLENAERDWEYLSGEERHGTVLQALEELERAERLNNPCVCNGCGREVTLMGNGRCGFCQRDDETDTEQTDL